MPRCIIFCGRPVEEADLLGLRREAGDLVVGADSGYLTARRLGFFSMASRSMGRILGKRVLAFSICWGPIHILSPGVSP